MKREYLYPAMITCMSEARRPNGTELKTVIRRIRSEMQPEWSANGRLRRRITWVALAALGFRSQPR